MGYFDGIQNPWAPGGQMSPRMPWSQPGLDYGWGHGNEFFTPKTKEQIQQEALLQLAVLAAVLVAPAILRAGGGAGAAGGGSMGAGANAVGGSLGAGAGVGGSVGAGALGAGTAAEAAGGVLLQGGAIAAPAAGAAATGGLSGGAMAALLGVGAAQALQPFLQQDSSRVLQQAAKMGEEELNRTLHQLSLSGMQPVELQNDGSPLRSPVDRITTRGLAMRGDLPMHESVPMILELREEIRRRPEIQNELRTGQISQRSMNLLRIKMEDHPPITNWASPSNKNTLKSSLPDDSTGKSPCPMTPWSHLLKYIYGRKVMNEIDRRNRIYWQHHSWDLLEKTFNEWKIQTIDNGIGDKLNVDYYEVKVTKLPVVNGVEISEFEIFRYWKQNFDSFLLHNIANFREYSPEDKDKFLSEDPVGAVMYFDMNVGLEVLNPDDGSVMVTDSHRNSWTFSTVKTPEDHMHPVSGNREFGFKFNTDGTYSFYVKGVDRLTSLIEYGTDIFINDFVFNAAHILWSTWQANFARKIIELGGTAEVQKPISKRVSWEVWKNCK